MRGRLGLALGAAGLSVLLAASVAFAIVFVVKNHRQEQQAQARSEAVAAAQQFALRMDNFDGQKLDAYIASVDALLTTKAKSDFATQFKTFKQVYQQGNTEGTGKVLVSGVASVDPDSATVLVVHDATVKSDYGTQVRHLRWSVALDKVKGDWQVDSFEQVS